MSLSRDGGIIVLLGLGGGMNSNESRSSYVDVAEQSITTNADFSGIMVFM